ncbi:hypothetical protein T11_12598 [Trichinella zimbabwensis]|uniref:Uncharacterized protein n=1 Tax=Trichinella zimbabwensis TaxID=268475 RepID=A0A0V1GXS6_9BILA|nr:hypothetical protein T11_12598 [Trichinella zimbabwensis]
MQCIKSEICFTDDGNSNDFTEFPMRKGIDQSPHTLAVQRVLNTAEEGLTEFKPFTDGNGIFSFVEKL